jgi:AraC family transcriptional regulator
MDVSVRQIPSYRVACVRHTGSYGEIRDAWERIVGWAARSGLLGRGPLVGVAHDLPRGNERVAYDACVGVGRDVVAEDPIEIRSTPSGLFAVTIHRGPYRDLHKVYESLLDGWLNQGTHALRVGQPFLEFYLNSPRQVAESDLITEICIPVERTAPEEPEVREGEPGMEEMEPGLDDLEAEEEEEEELEIEAGEAGEEVEAEERGARADSDEEAEEEPAGGGRGRKGAGKAKKKPAKAPKPAAAAPKKKAAPKKEAEAAAPKKKEKAEKAPAKKKAPAAKKPAAKPKKK